MRVNEAELSERSGVAPERIRLFVDLGILEPDNDVFRPPDVQLVRIFEALDASGIGPEVIAKLMKEGNWSNAWADLVFPSPFPYLRQTIAEVADELDLPRPLVGRLYSSWQIPFPGWDQRVREDDAEVLRMAAMVYTGIGRNEEGTIAVARSFGDNLRRIAETQAHFFREHVEDPLYASGMKMRDAIQTVALVAQQFIDGTGRAMQLLHSRHLEHYTFEDVVQNLELSLEQSGLASRRPRNPPAIAFLDLTGYTSLTEQEGDEAAVRLAGNLSEMVSETAARHGGNVVKLLGDGVMFHFKDPAGAIVCGLDLVDASAARKLPPARVGVNAGSVIFRDGDYFGRTVNIAARVTDYARPGEVLVTRDALARGTPVGVQTVEIGEVALKGLAQPVSLSSARRAQG